MIVAEQASAALSLAQMACRIDWTALCTMLLTFITGYYAWRTTHILNATTRQAAAAEETLALLVKDRKERLQQLKAPLSAIITESLAMAEKWNSLDFSADGPAVGLWDSRELEAAELLDLAVSARAQNYVVGKTLFNVDAQIVSARAAIDILTSTRHTKEFPERVTTAREAIRRLRDAWRSAEKAVLMWQ
jgi:hypothetical protein